MSNDRRIENKDLFNYIKRDDIDISASESRIDRRHEFYQIGSFRITVFKDKVKYIVLKGDDITHQYQGCMAELARVVRRKLLKKKLKE